MLGDSLLDAAIKEYQPVDVEGAITGAQKYQENQNTLQGQKQALQEGQLKLGEETEETPLRTALVKEQAKNSLLSDAIAKSTDAQSWDANMRKLSQQFPEAAQYIGRYTPVLQSRLMSVYGGQPGGAVGLPSEGGLEQPAAGGKGSAASAGGGSANLDYQFAQTTPDQRAQALKSISSASDGLEQVGSAAEWDALKMKLHAAGVPMMDQIGDYSPIKAASIYQRLQPLKQYLENRAIADQAGIPAPKPAPDIRVAGNSVFSVDPYAGTAKLIGQSQEYGAVADGLGGHVIYSKTTGKTVGSGSAGGSGGNDLTPPKVDPGSGSLTAQTGLSQGAINSLIGSPNQPRGVAYQTKINNEITKWANKQGIDTSTFRAQATAYNNILQNNIQRNNQGVILENEIQGSVDNLAPMLDAAKRGKIRYLNQAQGWTAQQGNDPQATQIADQINRFRNELAGYNAVAGGHLMQNGQPEPTPDDFMKADNVLSTGINHGSVQALADSVKLSADKNRKVLANTVDDTREAVWNLFGVGKNYKRQSDGSSGGATPPPSGPPPSAVTYLKAHPDLKSHFDEKYGTGAADKILGGK